jgi:23S rRNA (uridine2552-2'-O)-methyltransferase
MTYRRKDSYYTRAKAAGYRSRAAYKLLELARRFDLIRRGDHVVDLGAWPGGWMQVAAELAGPKGIVVGIDLAPVDPIGSAGVSFIQGSALEHGVREEALRRCAGRVDVVLSDMAPKLSGVKARDEAQAEILAEGALEAARALLRPHGHLLLKVFMTAETEAFLERVRAAFCKVKLTKPEATRKGSAELYLVALDLRPEVPAARLQTSSGDV